MVIGRESKGHKGVEADPDNSLHGQLARVFKRKQRRAIAFRSLEFLCCLCDTIGMVCDIRLDGKDAFAETAAIFGRSLTDVINVPALSVTG